MITFFSFKKSNGCTTNNFPLLFKDVQIELREAEFNEEFLKGFVPRLEWSALVDAAKQLGDTSLPTEQPEMFDEELLKSLHHVLLEIHVEEGAMVCQNCGHVYPIKSGIPNMLLTESEVS
ncbi:Trm112p-domain-containing protein [Pyrrhoderma noxium]|uniref:Trm112p-domain-containing protein n=1 Tax=Pyrrhoderma noxium TaxID=2282107 RepID=A0A286U4W1_9AGAM|nr:Trm112p-domain-containing protein [Pyrrhoderma noxium]